MNDFNAHCPDSWKTTIWEKVEKGCGEGDAARHARKELLLHYHEVVLRYFRAKIRDLNVADELYSNFALKLMQSDRLIGGADKKRGRFRHYLKAALHNMVIDYYRDRARSRPGPLPVEPPEPARPDPFIAIAQEVLLNKAWAALKAHDDRTGQHQYAVLRRHSDNPKVRSAQHAERLTADLGKRFTPVSFRQALRRARIRFELLLLEEVARWSQSETLQELEDATTELKLLTYCGAALEKRRQVVS